MLIIMKIQAKQSNIIHKGRFTALWGTEFVVNGRTRVWEWLEKFDIVYILPITPEGKYIFLKQFRLPINAYVIETPAGIIEKENTHEQLALRELEEETGYTTSKPLEVLPTYPISAAITNGIAYGFCARDVVKIKEQDLEDAEDIEVLELSKKELLDMITNRDAKCYLDPRLLGLITIVEQM
jgi:ADP-ribose pyrophosphatase